MMESTNSCTNLSGSKLNFFTAHGTIACRKGAPGMSSCFASQASRRPAIPDALGIPPTPGGRSSTRLLSVTANKRVLDLPPGVGGMPSASGIAGRLEAWLAKHEDMPGAPFLQAMVPWAVKKFSFDPDKFVHELVDSIIGDHYPVPDRMLVHNEHCSRVPGVGHVRKPAAGRKVQDLRGRGRHRRHVLHFQVAKKQPDSQSRRHDSARGADLHAVPRDGASGGLRPPLHRGACETGGSVSVSG